MHFGPIGDTTFTFLNMCLRGENTIMLFAGIWEASLEFILSVSEGN